MPKVILNLKIEISSDEQSSIDECVDNLRDELGTNHDMFLDEKLNSVELKPIDFTVHCA